MDFNTILFRNFQWNNRMNRVSGTINHVKYNEMNHFITFDFETVTASKPVSKQSQSYVILTTGAFEAFTSILSVHKGV